MASAAGVAGARATLHLGSKSSKCVRVGSQIPRGSRAIRKLGEAVKLTGNALTVEVNPRGPEVPLVGQGTATFEVFEAALMLISANAASGEEELDGLRFGEADSSGIVFAVGNRPK